MTLFEPEEVPAGEPQSKLTTGQRRRRRQDELISSRVHPINGRPLLVGAGETCGDCRFRELGYWGRHARPYPKCLHPTSPRTHGPGTDVLASFPACCLFERTPGLIPGARPGLRRV